MIAIEAGDVVRLQRALAELPQALAEKAAVRALNRTGDTVHGKVARQLAKQTGAQLKRVRHVLKKRRRASPSRPEFLIAARDQFLSLKDFRPRRLKAGVAAGPWGQRRVFKGTFFGPGGHVFKRIGRGRTPVEKLWGPAIPREMVRGGTEELVRKTAADELPKRVVHEAGRELARVKARHRL